MQGHNCWVKWLVLFLLFLGKLLTVFHRSCTDLHYHQQPTKIPLTSYSLQDLFFLCSFVDKFSDMCELISQCGFDLHFPDDLQCGASFHVPVSH